MPPFPPRRWWTHLAGTCALLCPLAAIPNGWEHGAIPFEALAAALAGRDDALRTRAATSLGLRADPRAAPLLINALEQPEPHPEAREAQYRALGLLAVGLDPGTIARIERMLLRCSREDKAPAVQSACVEGLGAMRSPAALERLQALATGNAPPLIRARAVDALGAYPAATGVLASLVHGDAGGAMRSALRPRAIAALGRTGHADAVPPLLKALDQSRDDNERIAVLRALSRLESPLAAPRLIVLLDSAPSAVIRYEATTALAAVRDGGIVQALQRQLDDTTPAVRLAAIGGLRSRADPGALPALVRLAGRELVALQAARDEGQGLELIARAGLATAVLGAIHELGAPIGTAVLLQAARLPRARDSESPATANAIYQVRRVAWYGLGYTGSPEAIQWLASRAAIGDPDARLRAVAIRSLGVLGARDVLGRSVALLRDADAEVRWTTAETLGLARVTSAAPQLAVALDDPHALVRQAAAEALGWLRHDAARARLVARMHEDPDERVRSAATLSIGLIDAARPR